MRGQGYEINRSFQEVVQFISFSRNIKTFVWKHYAHNASLYGKVCKAAIWHLQANDPS